MTPEQAAALRAPFPANAIGQLPRPTRRDAQKGNCDVCGGWHGLPAVHLDYVGHAAATDRLLAVDPDWTWEPFALDDRGLPAHDRDGNLWIRLTVCGVTRPGVGDGASMKERIGDAIRNAAMRFGVALDLWAKEDLHDLRQAPEAPEGNGDDVVIDSSSAAGAPSDAQTRLVAAEFRRAGFPEPAQKHEIMSALLDREVTSWKTLTRAEASRVIDHVKELPDAELEDPGDGYS